MEFYTTEHDREMAREVWAPYAQEQWELRGIMVERIAEAIAKARQEERRQHQTREGAGAIAVFQAWIEI